MNRIQRTFETFMAAVSRIHRVDVAMACGIFATTLGLLTLTGYALRFRRLYQFFPSYVPVAPFTALGILACGIGIMVLAYRQEVKINRLEADRR